MSDEKLGKLVQTGAKRGKKALRNQTVISKAMTGKSNNEIAAETGLSRNTVSRILNSDEVAAAINSINDKLAAGIDDAINTVLLAVKHEYGPARDLLQNFGHMKAKAEIDIGERTLEQILSDSKDKH